MRADYKRLWELLIDRGLWQKIATYHHQEAIKPTNFIRNYRLLRVN